MEIILISIIILAFFIYLILAFWYVYIVCIIPPDNKVHYTKVELEVNWETNQPPILMEKPWLSFFVKSHLLFYYLASILGVILVYSKSKSYITVLLSVVVFLFSLFVLEKTIQLIVVARVKKYW